MLTFQEMLKLSLCREQIGAGHPTAASDRRQHLLGAAGKRLDQAIGTYLHAAPSISFSLNSYQAGRRVVKILIASRLI